MDVAERLTRLGFEYDGRNHHLLPTDRDADGMRDLECLDNDVLVIRVTRGMLRNALVETRERIIAIRARRLRTVAALQRIRR